MSLHGLSQVDDGELGLPQTLAVGLFFGQDLGGEVVLVGEAKGAPVDADGLQAADVLVNLNGLL